MLSATDPLFRATAESIAEALVVTDATGRAAYVNGRFSALLGYSLDDFSTCPVFHRFTPEDAWPRLAQAYAAADAHPIEVEALCKNGGRLWIRFSAASLKSDAGEPIGTLVTLADIAHEKLANGLERQLATIVEATSDIVGIADKDGRVTYLNSAGKQLLGLTDEEYRGQPLGSWHPDWAREKIVEEAVAVAAREGFWEDETAFIDKQGRQIPVSQVVLVHKDDEGGISHISTIARDISERKANERQIEAQKEVLELQKREMEEANVQLRELATVDGLTELKNQRAFYERLQDVTQYSVRYYVSHSLLLLDVDNFKEFNDSFGHVAGDEVLRTMARILVEQTRDTDFVARYGGEEFAIILPLANREESRLTAERIRRAVAVRDWKHRPVTASIGVATAIGNEYELRDFVFVADQALYESKRRGRNRVTCAADLKVVPEQGHIVSAADAATPEEGSRADQVAGDEGSTSESRSKNAGENTEIESA